MTSLGLRTAGAVVALLVMPFLTAESCGDEQTAPPSPVPAPPVGGDTAHTSQVLSSSDVPPGPRPTTPLIPEPTGTPTTTPEKPDTAEVTEPPATP